MPLDAITPLPPSSTLNTYLTRFPLHPVPTPQKCTHTVCVCPTFLLFFLIPSPCRCAKLLLRHGAAVDLPSEEAGETALHVAARHGLYDHAHLYLRHGARVDARSVREETAMGVLCGHAPDTTGGDNDDLLRLCRLLAAHGADLDARDEGHRSPLHKACRAANAALARFLLRRGADVNAIDYDGLSPLGCALQAAAFRRERRPHQAVQLLLNHGSQKIWPPAFAKVPRA